MKVSDVKFKVGDTVEATAKIWRQDGRFELLPGDRATICRVFQTTPDSPQIVDLAVKDRLFMGDIVCFEHVPLRIVW